MRNTLTACMTNCCMTMTTEKQVVYVVYHTNVCDQESLVGIYSTREKAEKRIKGYTFWDQRAMHIEEEVVE